MSWSVMGGKGLTLILYYYVNIICSVKTFSGTRGDLNQKNFTIVH